MSGRANAATGDAIKQAIEASDARMLASYYAEDAMVRIIDRNNPPCRPREIKGKAAIDMSWDDVCSRTATHHVEDVITEGNRIAFTQACAYPDGTKVFSASILVLNDGRIVGQTVVQAWDE